MLGSHRLQLLVNFFEHNTPYVMTFLDLRTEIDDKTLQWLQPLGRKSFSQEDLKSLVSYRYLDSSAHFFRLPVILSMTLLQFAKSSHNVNCSVSTPTLPVWPPRPALSPLQAHTGLRDIFGS